VFQVLREESERVTELKTASGGRLPAGTLMLGAEGIKQAIHNFEDARKVDLQNERLPPSQEEIVRKSDEDRRAAMERAAQEADKDEGLATVARRISMLSFESVSFLPVSQSNPFTSPGLAIDAGEKQIVTRSENDCQGYE